MRTRSRTNRRLVSLVVAVLLLAAGCGGANAPATTAPNPAAGWDAIVQEARGKTVNFYMYGGTEATNTWVTGFAAESLQEQYGIKLNMVPVADIAETVNKILGEKQAGRNSDGSVDLMWINGENFRTMRQADLLHGPWSKEIPNSSLVNWDDPGVAKDFGFSVDGYESPYGKAQFVMVYDSARVPTPPRSVHELLEWAKQHPGRFTYPAPPDFTGSAFLRHICYSTSGGYQQFTGKYSPEAFEQKAAPCFKALKGIEGSLWRQGTTYPESHTQAQDLFANGEIDFDMSYNPSSASAMIAQGKYPATTRTFVFDEGTIANTHYVAIPFNAKQKSAAMVTANFFLSPGAQFSKADPAGWGDLPAIEIGRVPADWQAKFQSMPLGPATLPPATLAAHRVPEVEADWLTAFEKTWEEQILHGP